MFHCTPFLMGFVIVCDPIYFNDQYTKEMVFYNSLMSLLCGRLVALIQNGKAFTAHKSLS